MSLGEGRQAGTATVLFTDLVGSTALRQSLGDDRADELRRQHDRLVREALSAHGGTEVKALGDGFMVVFGASAEAVAAAVDLQRAVARFNRRSPAPLALRVGISAGDVAWEDGDCYGTPVVEARRLCDSAEGGQILAADVVRLLAGSRGGHRFLSVGALTLKGLADAVAAAEVAWEAEEGAALPLPTALAGADTVAFVGRQEERARLARGWKEAQAGELQVMLISGEPGVGKTRLAAEVARAAHEEGATVLFGRCDEDLAVPYQPFVEALDAYVAWCSADELAEQAGLHGGDLARLLPRLTQRVRDLPEPLRAEPETERFRLFEAVRDFVAGMAAATPIVLLLDDIHWAAKATLLLLRQLVRGEGPLRLLLLATYRDTELGRGHPLAEMLADLRREPGVERVALRGLSSGEVDAFVEAAAGQPLDEGGHELARAVHAETEGNPFFVGQVLRHLVETGAIVNVEGRWQRGAGSEAGIPEGVREVIGRRLSRLSPETNDVLSAAAVMGREFDAGLLTALGLAEEDIVLDALEEAEQARLIVGVPGRGGRYTFAHALVRSTLYDELSTMRRLRLHRRVAQTLSPRAGTGEAILEEIAHHYCECAALGEGDNAVQFGTRAARKALDRLAYEEAATWFERVLSVLDPDQADPDTRAELLIELGQARFASGDADHARTTLDAALDLCRRAGRAELFTRAAIARGGRRGWSEAGLVDEVLISRLEEALAMLPPGDSAPRAAASARLASELYFRAGEFEHRLQLAADAVAMARRVGDPDALAAVLLSAQFGTWIPGAARDRLEMAREIVRLGQESGDLEVTANGLSWLQGVLFELGDVDGVREVQAQVEAAAVELRMPTMSWTTGVRSAALAIFEGRLDDGMGLMDAAYENGQRAQMVSALQMYGVALMDIRLMRGGVEELVPLIEAMVEQYPAIPSWRAALAWVHAEAGNDDEARRALDVLAADDFASIPRDGNWHPGVAVLGVVVAYLGDAERGAVLYDLLAPHADLCVCAGMPALVLGSGHWPTGLAAAAAGRLDEAVGHLGTAVDRNREMGGPPRVALVSVDLARVLIRRGEAGDVARAKGLLEDCLATCRAHDLPGLAAKAQAVLDAL